MQMIGLFVKLVCQIMLPNIIKDSDLYDIETLTHHISQSTCMRQVHFMESVDFVFLILISFCILSLSSVALLDKLNLKDCTIAIINISKAIRAPLA